MSTLPHNRKRLSPWAIFAFIAALLLLMALSPVALFLVWNARQGQRVKRELVKIENAGQPLTVYDLSKAFPLEPGAEDVTQIWMAGLDPLETEPFKAAADRLPFVGVNAPEVKPKLGAPWPEITDAEKFLEEYRFSLDQFHEAARRGGHGRFPVDYTKGFETLLPYTQKARSAARLLNLEFEVKAHRGDATGAANTLKTMLYVPRCLVHEPTLISQLVPIAIDGITTSALAEKLCLLPFSDQDLREFQARLRSKTPEKNMRTGLLGERAMGHSAMRDRKLYGADAPAMAPFESDVATHLEFMSRYIAALDKGYPESLTESEKIENDLQQELRDGYVILTVYTGLIVPATSAALNATARNLATNQAADIGIAVELYRRENGKLPPTLDALVPQFLLSVPADPYNGKPMLYKAEDGGFTIYSVGKNGVDDAGHLDYQKGDEGLYFPVK